MSEYDTVSRWVEQRPRRLDKMCSCRRRKLRQGAAVSPSGEWQYIVWNVHLPTLIKVKNWS